MCNKCEERFFFNLTPAFVFFFDNFFGASYNDTNFRDCVTTAVLFILYCLFSLPSH
jgi:hypothetical protein